MCCCTYVQFLLLDTRRSHVVCLSSRTRSTRRGHCSGRVGEGGRRARWSSVEPCADRPLHSGWPGAELDLARSVSTRWRLRLVRRIRGALLGRGGSGSGCAPRTSGLDLSDRAMGPGARADSCRSRSSSCRVTSWFWSDRVGSAGATTWGICERVELSTGEIHTIEGNAFGRGPRGALMDGVVRCVRPMINESTERALCFAWGIRPLRSDLVHR